jgi:hypothetical protein
MKDALRLRIVLFLGRPAAPLDAEARATGAPLLAKRPAREPVAPNPL